LFAKLTNQKLLMEFRTTWRTGEGGHGFDPLTSGGQLAPAGAHGVGHEDAANLAPKPAHPVKPLIGSRTVDGEGTENPPTHTVGQENANISGLQQADRKALNPTSPTASGTVAEAQAKKSCAG